MRQASPHFRGRTTSLPGEMKMKNIVAILVVLLAAVAATSYASGIEFKQLSIDFTNSTDAAAKATWSDSDKITVSKDGLGRDDGEMSSRDGWIQTKSIPLGWSWRPAQSTGVRVAILPQPRDITQSNGHKLSPDSGDVYVRYSPDRLHWSTWQALQRAEPRSADEKKTLGRYYSASISVPHRERSEYSKLLAEYSRMDVPWGSDEEAAVQWILGRDPDFFTKQIPFIGYVEFLYETSFYSGQRIQSFKAEIITCVGGVSAVPRDPSAEKDRHTSPWRFEAKEKAKPTRPADGSPPR